MEGRFLGCGEVRRTAPAAALENRPRRSPAAPSELRIQRAVLFSELRAQHTRVDSQAYVPGPDSADWQSRDPREEIVLPRSLVATGIQPKPGKRISVR